MSTCKRIDNLRSAGIIKAGEEIDMDKIRIALIGYGNVGKAFAEMLLRREDYLRETFDTKAVITAICTATRGALIRPDGTGGDGARWRVRRRCLEISSQVQGALSSLCAPFPKGPCV